MKRLWKIMLVLTLCMALCLVLGVGALAADGTEPVNVSGVVIETAVQVVTCLLMTLIGVLGTWLTAKIGKAKGLETVQAATEALLAMARQTVGELQQTVVSGLKGAHADGKLTEGEITALGQALIERTREKLAPACMEVLTAAGVDITALIKGEGEAWINKMKTGGAGG